MALASLTERARTTKSRWSAKIFCCETCVPPYETDRLGDTVPLSVRSPVSTVSTEPFADRLTPGSAACGSTTRQEPATDCQIAFTHDSAGNPLSNTSDVASIVQPRLVDSSRGPHSWQ